MSELESKRETDVLDSEEPTQAAAEEADDCRWLSQAWQASRMRLEKDRQCQLNALSDYPGRREFDFARWLLAYCPFRDVRSTLRRRNRESSFVRSLSGRSIDDGILDVTLERVDLRLSEYVSIRHPLSPLHTGVPCEPDESEEERDDRIALCEWYLISGRVSQLDWLLWQTHRKYWMPMIEVFSQVTCLNRASDCTGLSRASSLALCIEACSMFGESSASVTYFRALFAHFEGHSDCEGLVSFGMRVLSRVLCYQPWTIHSGMIDEVIHYRDFSTFLSDSTVLSGIDSSDWSDSEGPSSSSSKRDPMSLESFVHSVIVIVTAQALAALMEGMMVPKEWDISLNCNPAWITRNQQKSTSSSTRSVSSSDHGSSRLSSSSLSTTKTKSKSGVVSSRKSIEEARLSVVSPSAYALFDTTPHSYVPTDEFNWRDGAFSIASRYAPESTDLLDECFRVAYSMTDDSAAGIEMDTLHIREAMRHCVDRMHGVRDDAYDYSELNNHLSISTKKFISKMVTDPTQLRDPEMSKCKLAMGPTESSRKFTDEEIVHIAILATESKRQTQLVHAMRALWLYTRKDCAF